MAIYAIADLHLGFDPKITKPMDIYGIRWVNHAEKIKNNWISKVGAADTVILAGDISWALKLSEAMADLEWIHRLPGKKVIIKGNHELWWSGIGRMNSLYEDIFFIQNNFFETEGIAICGSRGWVCPGNEDFEDNDKKIYARELLRLEMSLNSAKEAGYEGNIIAALHFPPTNDKQQPSEITALLEKYGVKKAVYGHLHGAEVWSKGLQGILNGVEYSLVSQDYLEGELLQLK